MQACTPHPAFLCMAYQVYKNRDLYCTPKICNKSLTISLRYGWSLIVLTTSQTPDFLLCKTYRRQLLPFIKINIVDSFESVNGFFTFPSNNLLYSDVWFLLLKNQICPWKVHISDNDFEYPYMPQILFLWHLPLLANMRPGNTLSVFHCYKINLTLCRFSHIYFISPN